MEYDFYMRCLLLFSLLDFRHCMRQYNGYRLIRLFPSGLEDIADILTSAANEDNEQLNLWSDLPSVAATDMSVGPAIYRDFIHKLKNRKVAYKILVDDIQPLIERQKPSFVANNARGRRKSAVTNTSRSDDGLHTSYHTYDQINEWLLGMCSSYPELAHCFNLGHSYEGRPMYAIRISSNVSCSCQKKGIFLDAAIHAREWIAPAVALYIIEQLLTNYDSLEVIRQLVDSMTWFILPVFNVDGYVYSWTTNRLWRKTRSPINGTHCMGVDANRNWNYKWNSTNYHNRVLQDYLQSPCSEVFRGYEAHSEIELQHVARFIGEHKAEINAYVTFHSYGNLLMWPWSYTRGAVPHNNLQMANVGLDMQERIKAVYGTHYDSGNIAQLLGSEAGGTSVDYMHGKCGLNYSYAVELPGASSTPHTDHADSLNIGFLLPPEKIIPTSQEIFEGIVVLAMHLLQSNVPEQFIFNMGQTVDDNSSSSSSSFTSSQLVINSQSFVIVSITIFQLIHHNV